MQLFLFETQTTQYLNSCILTAPSPMKVPTTFLLVKVLWILVYSSWGFSNSCFCISFLLFCYEESGGKLSEGKCFILLKKVITVD